MRVGVYRLMGSLAVLGSKGFQGCMGSAALGFLVALWYPFALF